MSGFWLNCLASLTKLSTRQLQANSKERHRRLNSTHLHLNLDAITQKRISRRATHMLSNLGRLSNNASSWKGTKLPHLVASSEEFNSSLGIRSHHPQASLKASSVGCLAYAPTTKVNPRVQSFKRKMNLQLQVWFSGLAGPEGVE